MTTCTCRTCNCSEEEIAAFNAATSPLQRALDEFEKGDEIKGDYDLDSLVGHIFYHESDDYLALLGQAMDWLEDENVTLLNIRYDNSTEGGKYSESITVIAEQA